MIPPPRAGRKRRGRGPPPEAPRRADRSDRLDRFPWKKALYMRSMGKFPWKSVRSVRSVRQPPDPGPGGWRLPALPDLLASGVGGAPRGSARREGRRRGRLGRPQPVATERGKRARRARTWRPRPAQTQRGWRALTHTETHPPPGGHHPGRGDDGSPIKNRRSKACTIRRSSGSPGWGYPHPPLGDPASPRGGSAAYGICTRARGRFSRGGCAIPPR
jgi:hypothetical protein